MQGSNEPESPAAYGRAGSGSADQEHYFIFHGNLTKYDLQGNVIALAAQKVPTLADGDWQVRPDGMEVTWKLRTDVRWHDGTPLTADDFVFGFQVAIDRELAVQSLADLPSITDVRAADPQTLIIAWKALSVRGNANAHDGVPAIPRHLLGDLYHAGDKVAFENSALWNTQWVGLGPYRLANWVQGTQIEGAAFDGYFLGRPKFDHLVIRYVGDPNALVASVLAGEIDVVPLGAQLDLGQMVAVRQDWEARGEAGLTLPVPKGVRAVYLQFRDPNAPWVADPRARKALLHALDREQIVESMLFGLTPRADFLTAREDPVYPLIERQRLPTYDYDQARVERLLAEAGWSRGGDRLFRNAAGQSFAIDVTSSSSGDNVRENQAIAGQWSAAGFESNPTPYGRGVRGQDAREARHVMKGALIWPWNFSLTAPGIVTSKEIGTERNRWVGDNYGGYSNPAYDALYERFTTELDAGKRQEAQLQMLKIAAEELPVLPVFYTTLSLVARKGLEGPGMVPPVQPANSWNIHEWTLR
jgi:peptide/nickel transport system substrate-binding protein